MVGKNETLGLAQKVLKPSTVHCLAGAVAASTFISLSRLSCIGTIVPAAASSLLARAAPLASTHLITHEPLNDLGNGRATTRQVMGSTSNSLRRLARRNR